MLVDDHDSQNPDQLPVLSAVQRRVLGVLLEKGFTTPEYYPMTLKAIVAGCSQKSNRAPVVVYDPDRVQDALDELRTLGLVAERHTESGRTVRYRHHMRQNIKLTEPQLAILTELLLRGRQRLGELRTRASRMVSIERQDDLRHELVGLMQKELVRSNGPLERRGIEVDHCLYDKPPAMESWADVPPPQDQQSTPGVEAATKSESEASLHSERLRELEGVCEQLTTDQIAMRQVLDELSEAVTDLKAQVQRLASEWDG